MKARARVSEENKERSVFFHQAVKGPEKALKTTWSNFFYKDLSLFSLLFIHFLIICFQGGCFCSSQSNSFDFQTARNARGLFLLIVNISVLGAYFHVLALGLLPPGLQMVQKSLQHDCLKYLKIISMGSLRASFFLSIYH